MPEVAQGLFGDAERAQHDQGAQEFEVGAGIGRAFKRRQLKALLQAGQVNRRAVQGCRDVGQGTHARTIRIAAGKVNWDFSRVMNCGIDVSWLKRGDLEGAKS